MSFPELKRAEESGMSDSAIRENWRPPKWFAYYEPKNIEEERESVRVWAKALAENIACRFNCKEENGLNTLCNCCLVRMLRVSAEKKND